MKKKTNTLRVFSRHPTHSVLRRLIPVNNPTVLRLGSQTPSTGLVEINTVQSIVNSSNKLIMKDLFAEAGVNTPAYYKLTQTGGLLNGEHISYENLSELFTYPILAKRTFRSKGVGMKKLDTQEEFLTFINRFVYNNPIQIRNPYYIEIFHNYTKEYRLHISKNGCFYACRKMLKADATENRWYRNDSNSIWITELNLTKDGDVITYEGVNETFDKPITWDAIIEDCQKARTALGLDICCFDIKVNSRGNWKILESNSAPSFGEITTLMYINELKSYV